MEKIDPHKSITDVVIFNGALNVHIVGELLKIQYPKVSVMRGVLVTCGQKTGLCWALLT